MSIEPGVPAKTLTQLVAMEIRVAMTRADIRQSELARRIGKTEQWLSVRLRGKQPIDLNDLALIANGLGVPFQALLPTADQAAWPAGSFNATLHTTTPSADVMPPKPPRPGRTDDPATPRLPQTGPYAGGRRDSTRPVSSVPATQRRPKQLRPAGRSSDRRMPR